MIQYDVFLSHSNADKPAVEELARAPVVQKEVLVVHGSPTHFLAVQRGILHMLEQGPSCDPNPPGCDWGGG